MKKIFLFAAVAVSALLSSCEMELLPEGAIKQEEAIVNPVNARYFRNGLYNSFRGLCMGALNNYTEVQMDNFQALAPVYGNNLGNIFKGDFTSATEDFAGAFSLFYSNIAGVNFYLPRLQELIESDEWTEQDHMKMIRYRGEAYFFRAYNYFMLTQFFCQDYSEANKDVPAMGVPLVTEYNPTTDRSTYPGRSTLGETYKLILEDLTNAKNDLEAAEASMSNRDNDYLEMMHSGSPYVNSWVVEALNARIALAMGKKDEAATHAQNVIGSSLYKLSTPQEFVNMWTVSPGSFGDPDTRNSEIIMMAMVTGTEAQSLGQTNSLWWSYNINNSMYVPANSTLNMYTSSDYRKQIWFQEQFLELNGTYLSVNIFSKFIGLNTFAGTSSSRGCVIMYPFRLAEMYLILAECGSSNTVRNDALRALREARGISSRTYPDDRLDVQVRLERNRELIGEGFRLNDLRRYGEGFTRDNSVAVPNFPLDNFNTLYFVQGASDLSYTPDDCRFVWPIPSTEIQVNPQIVGQQNPGY